MKAIIAVVVAALVAAAPAFVRAEEREATAEPASIWPQRDYSGDLLSRRYLTGDWGGWRTTLAERGAR